MARRLSISPRYAQTLFAEFETSFTDELIERRLTRAREMLTTPRHSDRSVTEISYECGFSTVSHFHRVFRRRFETTPGDLRARARKGR